MGRRVSSRQGWAWGSLCPSQGRGLGQISQCRHQDLTVQEEQGPRSHQFSRLPQEVALWGADPTGCLRFKLRNGQAQVLGGSC